MTVLVAGAPRTNAGAKDRAWATAGRAGLEDMKREAGVAEVVLATEGGGGSAGGPALIEGLSSNLAVLEERGDAGGGDAGGAAAASTSARTLVAPGPASGALGGTVRAALVAAALKAGLAVEDRPVRVRDAGSWVGALLTSTSRGALPVGEVRWPEGSARPAVALPTGGLVAELDAAVSAAMAAEGEEV